MIDLSALNAWQAPPGWPRIHTIDMHTGGEPLRIIVGGFPKVPGATILERRAFIERNLDHLRTGLMREPRGHQAMYGCLVTPPVTPGASFGVIFMHNEGYSTMCGHGIIAVSKIAVDSGLVERVEPETHLVIDTPAGTVESWAHLAHGMVDRVRFRNVPSFVVSLDDTVYAPGMGEVRFDIAFGGAYYAFVDAAPYGLRCVPTEAAELRHKGMAIKHAIMRNRSFDHPFEKDLGFLYGTIFVAPSDNDKIHSRNVCIFADGQIDRSPTGTGVSGRLAIHFRRREIELNEPIVIESIVGSTFTGRIARQVSYGGHDAIIPEVEGTATVTGRSEFVIDPNDPWRDGFLLT